MFSEVAPDDVLAAVRSHDFTGAELLDVGRDRIDAIVALDRAIRAAQAEQMAQIAALHAERVQMMPIGRGDPALSVIGEVAMARRACQLFCVSRSVRGGG